MTRSMDHYESNEENPSFLCLLWLDNNFSLALSEEIFSEYDLGQHIWNKFLATDRNIVHFFTSLDKFNKQRLVMAYNHFVMQHNT